MDDFTPPPAIFKSDLGHGGWSGADTARQALALALLGADWAQTRTIAKDPYNGGQQTQPWHENNPLLGSHPSAGRVNNYFAATALGHTLLMNALPPEWRKWVQYGTIGVEGAQVRANKMLGIGMTF